MSKPKPAFPYQSLSDCDRPACDDIVSMFQEASRAADESASSGAATTAYANAPAEPLPEAKRIISKEANAVDDACPPTSAKLGRSTWTLLHTMAAWYPDEPSKAEQTSMKRFFSALGRFYPCPWCATDFRANLEEKPPQTGSRKQLCQWLCEQHNIVNQKLGKQNFPCDMASLDDRWRRSSKAECQKR